MKQKRILLHIKYFRPVLFESILHHAHQRGWLVEYYPDAVPENWYGDGAILDVLTPEILAQMKARKIPVATCSPLVEENVAAVHGHVEHNIKMVFDFFRRYGHRNLAVMNAHRLKYDPGECMRGLAIKNNLHFHCLYWEEHLPAGEIHDFEKTVKVVKQFIAGLPKPCGVYVGSILHVHVIYLACRQAGVAIGKDIALVANTDDPGYAENLIPSVTTIVGEFPDTGRVFVEELEKLMQGKPAPGRILFVPATKIIPRESTDLYAVEHPAVMKAIDFMIAHYGDPQLVLQEIVEAAECSTRMLQLNFKKYLHVLPATFLQNLRLEKAAELLETTRLTREQIAQNIGYGSGISLTLAFKKKYSLTPAGYRKKHRMENSPFLMERAS